MQGRKSGCGLKWIAFLEETDEIKINNAYKDYPVYDDRGNKIGHNRADGLLKTPESYRTVPCPKRLKDRLLRHKERQKAKFEKLGLKWTENEYVFLNKWNKPYISENLGKQLNRFTKKYRLEHMTAYGLRHSFATLMAENGMWELVLMKLMGHSKYETTRKYYIAVTRKKKQAEMNKVYDKVFNDKKEVETENIVDSNVVTQKVFVDMYNMVKQMNVTLENSKKPF